MGRGQRAQLGSVAVNRRDPFKDGWHVLQRVIPLYRGLPEQERLSWEMQYCLRGMIEHLVETLPRDRRFAVLISERWRLQGLGMGVTFESTQEMVEKLTGGDFLAPMRSRPDELVYEVAVDLTEVQVRRPVFVEYDLPPVPALDYCPCLWHSNLRRIKQRANAWRVLAPIKYRRVKLASRRFWQRWGWLAPALVLEVALVLLVAWWR